MDELLNTWVATWHWCLLLAVLAASVWVLGRGADWLVEEAVAISLRLRLPRSVIGATIVSLGTTTPETVVSVLAAIQGRPGLALGNAVGSIICDTGLILGLACLLRPLPIERRLALRQGWVQFAAGVMLILACVPWKRPAAAFSQGGNLPQAAGFLFIGLLVAYILWSIRLSYSAATDPQVEEASRAQHNLLWSLGKLMLAVAIVLVSSTFLIATASELAERLQVPPSIVAATLVAFGTSLPELMIAITATLKGHGELAVGNIIGADILNVLFVTGTATAVTASGLRVEPHFFYLQFPAMLFVLTLFRVQSLRAAGGYLSRRFGFVLLTAYVLVTVVSYLAE
jgi:cation:H+ antiporter